MIRLRDSLPAMRELAKRCRGHWTYEDGIYRFYHGSFKVYHLQEATLEIVGVLKDLAPSRRLDSTFLEIVGEGTGKTFKPSDNARWSDATRPIVEAFLHAMYFLEMGIRYGERFGEPPHSLPSGWAAFLTLYDLR